MKKNEKSLRSPLGHVRGLGSARHGTGHWWMQRLTAIALIPLTFYILSRFMNDVVLGNYESAILWLKSPLSAAFVIFFIGVGFHHAASGLQVVMEDYVHCEVSKLTSIIAVKFLSAAFALVGILTVLKILLGT